MSTSITMTSVSAIMSSATVAAVATSSATPVHSTMSMGGSSSSTATCKISMLWNWNTIDACFLSSSWQIQSNGMFAVSCIGVALLVVILEFLRRLGKEYDAFMLRQFRRNATAQIASRPQEAAESCLVPPQYLSFRPSLLQQFIRSLIHMATFGLAYIVMLLSMYFNGYIILSIIVGAFMGKFLCDWTTQKIAIGGTDGIGREDGCATCRRIRVKCDEKRPSCRRCEERLVVCEGYVQQIRWVDQITTRSTSVPKVRDKVQSDKEEASVGGGSYAKALILLPSLPTFQSPQLRNQQLFEHWLSTISPLIYLGCSLPSHIKELYISASLESNSVLLPPILANAAVHLSTLGRGSHEEVLELKYRAFRAVRNAIANFGCRTNTLMGTEKPTSCNHALSPCDDIAIEASIMLAGVAIMQGTGLGQLLPLLRGTASMIEDRYKYCECKHRLNHKSQIGRNIRLDSPLFLQSKKWLAYFDLMSCVPCVRPPAFRREFWVEEIAQRTELARENSTPDPVFGYCHSIFGLLSRSVSFVHSMYTNSTLDCSYDRVQDLLLGQLDLALRTLPSLRPALSDLGQESTLTHNACIYAAQAHAYATKIFLIRSTVHSLVSVCIPDLVSRLRKAIVDVTFDSSAITMMLWPLWVLGCESLGSSSHRQEVEDLVQQMYQRQHILNVKNCLDVLRNKIWVNLPEELIQRNGDNVQSSAEHLEIAEGDMELLLTEFSGDKLRNLGGWVHYCWRNKIELVLA